MSTILRLAVSGYQSLRDVRQQIGPLTVVTGTNGSSTTSLKHENDKPN